MARIFGTLLSLLVLISSSQATTTATLLLSIDVSGKIAAEVAINNQNANSASSDINLHILALPFSLRDDGSRPRYPEDVRLSILGKGDGYTLCALAIPATRQSTIIRFDDAFRLSESAEGKAKIALDISYPFLSQTDKSLIATSNATKLTEISVELPQEYDITELSFRPLTAQWVTKRKLTLETNQSVVLPLGDLWVVFPNPMKSQLQVAKIVLAFVVGILTLAAHIPAFRERRVIWSLVVFFLSIGVLALVFYFYYSLAKRLDFAEWAVGFIPHALYGLISSAFLLMARRWEATITGRVIVDGAPLMYSDVILWRIINGQRLEYKRLDALNEDSRYTFRVWMRQQNRFTITATARGTTEVAGNEFVAIPGQRIELPQIALQWRPIEVVASAAVAAAVSVA